LLGLPPVSQYANRQGMASLGPANSTVNVYAELMNAKSLNLTANNNTPYTWIWLDLHNGPLVLEVPPKVLGVIDDMWYHWVVDVGITGADKGRQTGLAPVSDLPTSQCLAPALRGRRRL